MHRNTPRRQASRKQTFADLFQQRYPKAGKDVYEKLPDPTQMATLPGPDDIEAWGKVHSAIEEAQEANVQRIIKHYGLNVVSRDFGGVPVLEVTPRTGKTTGKCSSMSTVVPTPCFLLAPP